MQSANGGCIVLGTTRLRKALPRGFNNLISCVTPAADGEGAPQAAVCALLAPEGRHPRSLAEAWPGVTRPSVVPLCADRGGTSFLRLAGTTSLVKLRMSAETRSCRGDTGLTTTVGLGGASSCHMQPCTCLVTRHARPKAACCAFGARNECIRAPLQLLLVGYDCLYCREALAQRAKAIWFLG
jgi:hypothetical protein